MNVGEKLKESFDNSNLSLREISEKTKISKERIYEIFIIQDEPYYSEFIKICDTLEIPFEEFFPHCKNFNEQSIISKVNNILQTASNQNNI